MAFFAMSHGKGSCDSVGGTVKRLAARASLQRACNNQIMTSRQLFDFASAENPSVAFYYATTEEHAQEAILLSHRFESARMIAGTHKLHCIRSVTSEVVEVKEFSNSKEFRLECVLPATVQDNKPLHQSRVMTMTDIKGYITAKYDGQWWLGCVLKTFPEIDEMEVSFFTSTWTFKVFSLSKSQ